MCQLNPPPSTLKTGYKDTHTLRNQTFKLRREFAEEIIDD
jgi:hypothetical protein